MLMMFRNEVSRGIWLDAVVGVYDVRPKVGSSSSSSTGNGGGIPRLAMWIASVTLAASLRVRAACDVSLEVLHVVGELIGGARQFAGHVSHLILIGHRQ